MAHATARRRLARLRGATHAAAVICVVLFVPLRTHGADQVYVWRDANGAVRFSAIDNRPAAESEAADRRSEMAAPQCDAGVVLGRSDQRPAL
jgi:hypothetical protein